MVHAARLRTATLLVALALAACVAWALAVAGVLPEGGEIWTLALFLLSLVLPIWCCFRRTGNDPAWTFDALQPGTVLAILFYVYTVVPAFHVWRDLDYQSDWTDHTWPAASLFRVAFVLSLLSLIAFRFGYVSVSHRHEQVRPPTEPPREWPASATVLAVTMLATGLPFRIYHLALFGGLTPNILLFLSPGYTIESGITIGGVPQFFEGFFDWGALLLLYRAMLTNRQKVVSILIVGVAAILAYLVSGKRSAILPFLLYPVIWHHYLRRRLSVGRAAGYFALGLTFMTGLLFLRTVGPVLATGGFKLSAVPQDIVLQPLRFIMNSPELAGFDMTVLAVQDRAALLHEIGGRFWGTLEYNLVGALYVIPRFLWPGKPTFMDIGTFFYQHAGGDQERVGFAVGIVGGLYLFTGLLGVVIGMAGTGAAFRVIYERLRPWNREPRRVFLYGIFIWMTFHFLRFGELGGTMAYFYQFELAGVIMALVILRPLQRPGMVTPLPAQRR